MINGNDTPYAQFPFAMMLESARLAQGGRLGISLGQNCHKADGGRRDIFFPVPHCFFVLLYT
jgi:hypothetical protein